MYNFRYNIKNKGISSCKQHNKNTQPPFPLYVVVKLYSSSQLKTLVNWPDFCAGISLPYRSLPELTRDITNWMISQHNRDGAFLPLTLKKGYINDHCKRQYQSKLQINHCNKTLPRNIIIYFPVSNRREPWYSSQVWRSRKLIQPIILEIDVHPPSYTCIKNFLTPLQTCSMPSKLPPTPFPTTPSSNYRNRIWDEVAWLMFGLHGLGNIPRGVIIQESLTFQQFSP